MNFSANSEPTSLQKLLAEHGVGLAPLSEIKDSLEPHLNRIGQLQDVHEEIWLVSAQRKLENPIATKLMSLRSIL